MTKKTKAKIRLHKWEDNQGNYQIALKIETGKLMRTLVLTDEQLSRMLMREQIEVEMETMDTPSAAPIKSTKAKKVSADRAKAEKLLAKVWVRDDEDAEPTKSIKLKTKVKTKKPKLKSSGTKGGDAFASLMGKMGGKK